MQQLLGLIKTMRPKQWTKNILFVFPAIVFDGKLFDIDSLIQVVFATILLTLMSGTVYIINDIVDIEKDKKHPRKKYRPLPAGQLSLSVARVSALLMPTISILLALTFSLPLTIVLALYLLLQVTYSFVLKHIVIVDVLAVMMGFVLRVIAGVVVIQVENFSPWLYICSGLLALFLVIGKRRQDLVILGEAHAAETRPIYQHYNLPLLDDMLRMVTTGTLITYILYVIEVYSLRLNNGQISSIVALFTIPFVVYGLFRYLYLIHVKKEGSAPDEVFLTDRSLQVAIFGWLLIFLFILYVD